MIHTTEGMLQALLDDEVAGSARAEIAEHLETCAACAAEYAELRQASLQAGLALAVLDAPAPVAAAYREVVRRRTALPARRTAWRGSLTRAAMLVLVAAGAASAALPGSPVREWLSGAWERVSALFGAERPAPLADAPVAEPAAPAIETYNAVALADGRVRIVIAQPDAGAVVRVRLVDGARAALLSTDAGIQVTTGRGLLQAVQVGAGTITVELPRGALDAAVEVGGRVVVRKDGAALRALVPVASESADEIVLPPVR